MTWLHPLSLLSSLANRPAAGGKVISCPQRAGRSALAVLRAAADGNYLHLVLSSAFYDFALATKAIRASFEACGLHLKRDGRLL